MIKVVTLDLDNAWVFAHKDDEQLPVAKILQCMKKAYGERLSIRQEGLTSCSFALRFDEEPAVDGDIKNTIRTTILDEVGIEDYDNTVSVQIGDEEAPSAKGAQPKEEVAEQSKSTPIENSAQEQKSGAFDRINALVGAEEFKALAGEITKIAPQVKKHNTFSAFAFQSYLFSINDGFGLTTYLNLLADLIAEQGLYEFKKGEKVREIDLRAPHKDDHDEILDRGLQALDEFHAGKQLVCVDLSEWISQLGGSSFKRFLQKLEERSGNSIYAFRVPFLERDLLLDVKRKLNDVLLVRDITFTPMDLDDLKCFAKKELNDIGFSMSDDAWDVFDVRIAEEKSDGKFYGIKTVQKVIKQVVYEKQKCNALSGSDNTLIERKEIAGIAETIDEHYVSGKDMLESLIGIESVKRRIEEIVAQIVVANRSDSLVKPCLHMRFTGNPGTGKTTVARIIGKMLKEQGILRNGNFFEYTGRDLVGRYVGHTAPKTAGICRDAYGSVLFIDEAYTLYKGIESELDFGREALDTLISEMENHRSDLVVIMAGYPDEMERLLSGNAGLASRMPFTLEFPNYTREELFAIFMSLANKNFRCEDALQARAREFFESISEDVLTSKDFSNARFVRNLFERTWGKAAMRVQLAKDPEFILKADDFEKASADSEFRSLLAKKKSRIIGFC